jgi:hypothetical protein
MKTDTWNLEKNENLKRLRNISFDKEFSENKFPFEDE